MLIAFVPPPMYHSLTLSLDLCSFNPLKAIGFNFDEAGTWDRCVMMNGWLVKVMKVEMFHVLCKNPRKSYRSQ